VPTIQVSTGYQPRGAFVGFHRRTQRWSSLVCHRRAGKTVACVADLVDAALRCKLPTPRFAYLAPYYTQAKDVAWVYLKQMVAPIPGTQINESELRVDLPNGGRVRLYGADNYDRLRGLFLDGIVLDEFADMDPRAWPEVIRPALSDRQGWAAFIGTPKGRNAFWEIHTQAERNPDWFSMTLRADDSGLIVPAELEDARQSMTPEQFAQEYLCSFEAAIVGAYFGKEVAQAEREGRIREVAYDPALPVYTAWDLGIGDSTAIWFWQAHAGEIRVIDFYENNGQAVDHYAKVIHAKPYSYAADFVPHDAKVREFTGYGRTRIEAMRGEGLKPRLVPDHKIMDGINAARVLFSRMLFDEVRCRPGLEALRQYRAEFDEKTKAFRDNPKHDWTSHAADAFRYMAMSWRELAPEKPKPKPEVRGLSSMTFDEILKRHDAIRNG